MATARRSTSRPNKARVGEAIHLRFGLVMVVGLIPLAAAADRGDPVARQAE